MRLRAPARAAAEAILGWCAVVATHAGREARMVPSVKRGKRRCFWPSSQPGGREIFKISTAPDFRLSLHRFRAESSPNLSHRAPNRIESRSFDWPNTGELGEFFSQRRRVPMRANRAYGFIDWGGSVFADRPGDGSVDEKAASPLFFGAPGSGLIILGVTMNVSQRASLDPQEIKKSSHSAASSGREQIQPTVGSDRAPAQFAARERVTTVGSSTASTSYWRPPLGPPSVRRSSRDWSAPIDPRFHRCRFLFEARRLSSPWARSRSS